MYNTLFATVFGTGNGLSCCCISFVSCRCLDLILFCMVSSASCWWVLMIFLVFLDTSFLLARSPHSSLCAPLPLPSFSRAHPPSLSLCKPLSLSLWAPLLCLFGLFLLCPLNSWLFPVFIFSGSSSSILISSSSHLQAFLPSSSL